MHSLEDVIERHAVEFPQELAAAQGGRFHHVAFQFVAMAFSAFGVIVDPAAGGLLFGVDAVPHRPQLFLGYRYQSSQRNQDNRRFSHTAIKLARPALFLSQCDQRIDGSDLQRRNKARSRRNRHERQSDRAKRGRIGWAGCIQQ